MVETSAFDSILDAVFIVAGDGKIVYCNDAAAGFVGSSVKRLSGKGMLNDLIEIKSANVLPFTEASDGRLSPTPIIETEYLLKKSAKNGKVQIAVRPLGEERWLFFMRDVGLEEALHSKYRSELAQKEDYARNLEKLVEARTAELRQVNKTLQAVLNSLGQGFFTFSSDGRCGPVYTKACQDVVETVPSGKEVWEVLAVRDPERVQFKKWCEGLFAEFLPFDEMKALGPNQFPHSAQKSVALDYFPIRGEDAKVGEVVVVATDKTAEVTAQRALEHERAYAAMIVKFVKNKESFLNFLSGLRNSLAELAAAAAQTEFAPEKVQEAFRVLHTIEGEAGTFSIHELRVASRYSQQILEAFKSGGPMTPAALHDYRESIESLAEVFKRFLAENSAIFQIRGQSGARMVEIPADELKEWLKSLRASAQDPDCIERFEEHFLSTTFEESLSYFSSLIQSVAEKSNKRVKPMAVRGGELRFRPEKYQNFFSNLVHAFRNAVDHGLEDPMEREWAGKPAEGCIAVEIRDAQGWFEITIADDGKGIDPGVIREKLIKNFPDRDFSTLSDDEILQTVFLPGFSSRDTIGEFSGRGVGLDALKVAVEELQGSIHVESTVGQGTKLHVRVPNFKRLEPGLRSA